MCQLFKISYGKKCFIVLVPEREQPTAVPTYNPQLLPAGKWQLAGDSSASRFLQLSQELNLPIPRLLRPAAENKNKINLHDEDIMKALLPERSGIYLKLCHGRTTDNKGKVSRVMMFS